MADAPEVADRGVNVLHDAFRELGWGEPPAPFVLPEVVPVEHRDEAYARKAASWCAKSLAGKTADLADMAPDSGRNNALNSAGLQLYRYVLAGYLDIEIVTDRLRDAALEAGLSFGEIELTLRSALSGAEKYGPQEPPLDPRVEQVEPQLEVEGMAVDPDTGEVVITDAEAASAAIRRLLPEVDWHALWADESEEEWIVEPLLPARRLVAIYSPPKLGKSLLSLEMACAIATGRDVLGVSIDRPRDVLYVDFENDPRADIRERLKAMGYGPGDLARLHYLSFPNLAALDSERGSQELMAAVAEYQCEVVVLDTVSRAIEGEENENDTWIRFYRHTGLKLKQAGVALLRLDHSGKDESKGQRGGSAKGGDVDAVWRLSKVSDDVFQLTCEMARMQVLEKTLVLHREANPLRHRVDAAGRSATFGIKIDAYIATLDAAGLPDDASQAESTRVLRAAGQTVTTGGKVIKEAVRKRSERSETASERWSD